ncbi:uncharacterized protein LOC120331587 [Styela clava]|uniref:uncharacterized protein LOC120331587 n=1 Tax=Styela clava TaxID=7725 RepID=UPI0019398D38|nr:uncharacterized protein LOC120331587 [Styela clava]
MTSESSDSSVVKYLVGAASLFGGGLALVAAYKLLKMKIEKTNSTEPKTGNVYESEKLLNEYLMFHYGGPEVNCLHDIGPRNGFDFPVRCAELCVKHYDSMVCSVERSLDIGCAVGRSTFELAKYFRESIGMDFSYGFAKTCEVLAKNGRLEYEAPTEGALTTKHVALVPSDVDTSRCSFKQGDACNLPLDIGQFGCVLAANLICRLPDPKIFLLRLKNLVAQGGICVILSPYTFLHEYTPKSKWLGGYKDSSGKDVRAFDTMKSILLPDFELVVAEDMPFLIRETARKHQWTVSHATVWRRRAV